MFKNPMNCLYNVLDLKQWNRNVIKLFISQSGKHQKGSPETLELYQVNAWYSWRKWLPEYAFGWYKICDGFNRFFTASSMRPRMNIQILVLFLLLGLLHPNMFFLYIIVQVPIYYIIVFLFYFLVEINFFCLLLARVSAANASALPSCYKFLLIIN